MFFRKKKEASSKKLDKLVTWIIIGWAVASMIWLSKTEKWKEIKKNVVKKSTKALSKGYELFGKSLAKAISFVSKKKSWEK